MTATTATTTTTATQERSRLRSAELERAIARDPAAFRILTGDRPTGPLHLGHYFGTLRNRVRLQDAGVQLLVLIADYQAITDRTAAAGLPGDVLGLVADYLAAGVDPDRAVIFAHSQVTAVHQLLLPFLSLVSVAELTRNPTVKDEMAAAGPSAVSALLLSYPAHQAADILSVHANLVPVGRDQLPHIELTRAIARRFNDRYSPARPYFAEPDALLSEAPLLLGTDGTKMGKSRRNALPIRATADETAALIAGARTDAERVITYDPQRRPEVSGLVLLAALCREEEPEQVAAGIGDGGAVALKKAVTDAVNQRFAGIRRRRAELARDPGYLGAVLAAGSAQVSGMAAATLDAVRELMHTAY